MSRTAVIFDLGRVLLEWFPERAIEQVLPTSEVPAFFERVGFFAWNAKLDAGGSFAEAEQALVARFPDDREAILAYRRCFDLTVPGYVHGTPAVLEALQRHGVTVGALSNWSAETFTGIRHRFDALNRFDALVVSGIDGVVKPEPASFALVCERLGVEPANAVFIDDSVVNVAAAEAFGLTALLFTGAERLRDDLAALGLPVPESLDSAAESEFSSCVQEADPLPAPA